MPSRVIVSLRVSTSPARAFEAFTRDIKSWWQPSDLFQVTPRGDGELAFEPPATGGEGRLITTWAPGKVYEIGKVSVWEPGERLRFGWRQANFAPGQSTEVEVRFAAAKNDSGGDETRVTVEHIGWDTIPEASAARHGFPEGPFLQRTADWWRAHLARMRTVLSPPVYGGSAGEAGEGGSA